MSKQLVLIAVLFGSTAFCAGLESSKTNSIYIAPSNGFEVNLTAALTKKDVPVEIVTSESEAHFILRSSPVQIHSESGVSKLARCAFAYCAGIQDSGEVSVQLVEKETHRVVWAYEVAKERAAKNRQSMAEAIAKHLRKEYFAQ